MSLWDDDEPLEELAAIDDADELCRQLLATCGGWGLSARHTEAVELLANVQGSGELPASLVALLLCTCRRWHRVTANSSSRSRRAGCSPTPTSTSCRSGA